MLDPRHGEEGVHFREWNGRRVVTVAFPAWSFIAQRVRRVFLYTAMSVRS